jgi:hypothetical protein
VTQVTGKTKTRWALELTLLLFVSRFGHSQSSAGVSPSGAEPQISGAPAKPAEELYLQLRNVGLDPARTYRIRGATLDRPALHVALEDGEISFTSDIAGRVTGAFFAGDGEVLLTPPNQVERASMSLFTGMAILEERFATAYLRFNDETFAELQPYFRPADDAREFSSRWNNTARNLAEQDALRLLLTFSRDLPTSNGPGNATADVSSTRLAGDRILHIRAQGTQLGIFDANFDTKAQEEVWAGQSRTVEGLTFYDLWTSFTPPEKSGRAGESAKAKNDDIAISRYRIQAEVDPPTTLAARANLQVEVRRGGERTLCFELSRFLQVREVEVDGRPVEFINNTAIDGSQLARRGNDLVAVVFREPLRQGQKLELKFVYKGDVLSEAGGGLLYVGARGTWYPNRGLLLSDFDLEFHYPPGWTLVATGKRVAQGVEDKPSDETAAALNSGEQVGHWITERPSGLAGFNLGRYDRASARAGEVTVEAYAARSMEKDFPRAPAVISSPPPLAPRPGSDPVIRAPAVPSPARNAQAVADRGARAIDFFSQRFGPYPYTSLELTQMPGPMSQGWPGLVFLSSYAFLTQAETEELTSYALEGTLNSLILPHETAHQWWGDLVGWRTYRDQWIVEALANYSALMMMEDDRPGDVRKILERYRTGLLEKNKSGESLRDAGPVSLGLRLNSSHFPNGYEAISYGRGTWLFHMLRHMLLDANASRSKSGQQPPDAEEPFVRALRKVRERYAGKAITTRELFAVFEEDLPRSLWYEGQKSLNWFVQGWIEGVALPHLSTQNVRFVKKAGTTEVSGTIVQKQAPQDLVSAVPVFAMSEGKPVLLGTVMADGPETAFRFAVPPGTRKIVLDAYQTMLTSPK